MRVRYIDKEAALKAPVEAFEDDAGDVAALEKLCFSDAWSESVVRDTFANAYDRLWMLEEELDNGVQSHGYACLRVTGEEAELLRICVVPSQRGRGCARMLMDAVLASAGELPVFLEVREGNTPARALYRSCGFAEIAVRRDYYSDPDEDAVIMKR